MNAQDRSNEAVTDGGEEPAAKKPKSTKKRLVVGGLGLAVIVATFVFVLPQIANYRSVWAVVKDLTWEQVGFLALTMILNLATYAPPWMAALPGLKYIQGSVLTLASTASTYIAPGGAAVGVAASYGVLRAWGFRGRPVTIAVAVTGVWNQFAMLGFPIVALGILTAQNERNGLLDTVALVGVVIFVVAVAAFTAGLWNAKLARKVGNLAARVSNFGLRLIRRGEVSWDGNSFVRFRDETVKLLARRWHVLTLATLAGQLTVFLVMLASIRVCGVHASQVSLVEAFAAWSIARLLGSLPITPGGIGIVEVGLTGVLVAFGGHNADVVAGVLVYRFVTIVPTLLLGLLAGATLKRYQPKAA